MPCKKDGRVDACNRGTHGSPDLLDPPGIAELEDVVTHHQFDEFHQQYSVGH